MAFSKTFQTLFSIKGKYEAGPAFTKANQDLSKTEQHANRVTGAIRGFHEGFMKGAAKMAAGFAAVELGARAFDFLTDTIRESIKAAEDVEKAHQGLKNSLERNWDLYKKTGQNVSQVTEELIKLAEQQEKTAFDAEDMEQVYSKLTDAMDPETIRQYSQAVSDTIAKTKGASASTQDMIDVAQQWVYALNVGKSPMLKQIGMTDVMIKAFKGMSYEQRKATLLEFVNTRLHGETARAFDTTAGKIKQMHIQLGNLYETLGKPFVARAGNIADSIKKIAESEAVQKLSADLAKIADEDLVKISKWFEDNGDKIPERLNTFFGILHKIWEVLTWIEDMEFGTLFKLLNWFKEGGPLAWLQNVGTPAMMPGLPGSPGGINPALQGGAAGQRAAEAATQAQTAAAAQKAAEEAGEAAGKAPIGTGWSTSPARIRKDFRIGEAATGAGGVAGTLKDVRASFSEELKDPAVRDKLMRVAQAEVGSSHPERLQAFMEEIMNQSASRHHTIAQTLTPAYFDTLRHGPLPSPSAKQTAKHEEALAAVLAGGNISGHSTGNWSGPEGRGFGQAQGGYMVKKIGGEQFGVEAADVPWVKRMEAAEAAEERRLATESKKGATAQKALSTGIPVMKAVPTKTFSQGPIKGDPAANRDPWGIKYGPWNQPVPAPPPRPLDFGKSRGNVSMEDAMMRTPGGSGSKLKSMIRDMNIQERVGGGTGGTNVASNPTINVHGVPAGQEGAVGREVQKALVSPNREMIAKIKSARSHEARLGYV